MCKVKIEGKRPLKHSDIKIHSFCIIDLAEQRHGERPVSGDIQ